MLRMELNEQKGSKSGNSGVVRVTSTSRNVPYLIVRVFYPRSGRNGAVF